MATGIVLDVLGANHYRVEVTQFRRQLMRQWLTVGLDLVASDALLSARMSRHAAVVTEYAALKVSVAELDEWLAMESAKPVLPVDPLFDFRDVSVISDYQNEIDANDYDIGQLRLTLNSLLLSLQSEETKPVKADGNPDCLVDYFCQARADGLADAVEDKNNEIGVLEDRNAELVDLKALEEDKLPLPDDAPAGFYQDEAAVLLAKPVLAEKKKRLDEVFALMDPLNNLVGTERINNDSLRLHQKAVLNQLESAMVVDAWAHDCADFSVGDFVMPVPWDYECSGYFLHPEGKDYDLVAELNVLLKRLADKRIEQSLKEHEHDVATEALEVESAKPVDPGGPYRDDDAVAVLEHDIKAADIGIEARNKLLDGYREDLADDPSNPLAGDWSAAVSTLENEVDALSDERAAWVVALSDQMRLPQLPAGQYRDDALVLDFQNEIDALAEAINTIKNEVFELDNTEIPSKKAAIILESAQDTQACGFRDVALLNVVSGAADQLAEQFYINNALAIAAQRWRPYFVRGTVSDVLDGVLVVQPETDKKQFERIGRSLDVWPLGLDEAFNVDATGVPYDYEAGDAVLLRVDNVSAKPAGDGVVPFGWWRDYERCGVYDGGGSFVADAGWLRWRVGNVMYRSGAAAKAHKFIYGDIADYPDDRILLKDQWEMVPWRYWPSGRTYDLVRKQLIIGGGSVYDLTDGDGVFFNKAQFDAQTPGNVSFPVNNNPDIQGYDFFNQGLVYYSEDAGRVLSYGLIEDGAFVRKGYQAKDFSAPYTIPGEGAATPYWTVTFSHINDDFNETIVDVVSSRHHRNTIPFMYDVSISASYTKRSGDNGYDAVLSYPGNSFAYHDDGYLLDDTVASFYAMGPDGAGGIEGFLRWTEASHNFDFPIPQTHCFFADAYNDKCHIIEFGDVLLTLRFRALFSDLYFYCENVVLPDGVLCELGTCDLPYFLIEDMSDAIDDEVTAFYPTGAAALSDLRGRIVSALDEVALDWRNNVIIPFIVTDDFIYILSGFDTAYSPYRYVCDYVRVPIVSVTSDFRAAARSARAARMQALDDHLDGAIVYNRAHAFPAEYYARMYLQAGGLYVQR